MQEDLVNAAQMQSLGKEANDLSKKAGPVEVWMYDKGYNSGGLKRCWNCYFTCDFSADLEAHWQSRHGLKPLRHDANPISIVDRVVGRTRREIEQRISRLEEERKLTYNYLAAKLAGQDMEAVALAARGIREVNVQLEVLKWVLAE